MLGAFEDGQRYTRSIQKGKHVNIQEKKRKEKEEKRGEENSGKSGKNKKKKKKLNGGEWERE